MTTSFTPLRFFSRIARVCSIIGFSGVVEKVINRLSLKGRAYRRDKQRNDAMFDAGGYDTGGIQRLYTLTLADDAVSAAGVTHIAVPPFEFNTALDALDIDPTGFTFIDLGSGKGRAVLLAADRPFARVIGVEFALELHRLAERNLELRTARCGRDERIELIYGDASMFRFPERPTILFLYNPFGPPVLPAVVANALASWRASPRPFRVVYLHPVHLSEWTGAGWILLSAGNGTAILAPPGFSSNGSEKSVLVNKSPHSAS